MAHRRWLVLAGGSFAAFLFLLASVSCTPQTAYIEADRATFDALTPAYLEYVNGDPALDDEQRDRRARLVDSWRIRLEKAEGGA